MCQMTYVGQSRSRVFESTIGLNQPFNVILYASGRGANVAEGNVQRSPRVNFR
jgi:hypothetical protein